MIQYFRATNYYFIRIIPLIFTNIGQEAENQDEQGESYSEKVNKYKRNNSNKVVISSTKILNQITKLDNQSRDIDINLENEKHDASANKVNKEKDETLQSISIVNSLCNYLLILIEDLNAYVKLNNKEFKNETKSIILQEELLVEILNFCYLIFYTKQKFNPNKQNIRIKLEYITNIENIKIRTNDTKLKQLIINLLSNAYKFTSNGDIVLSAVLNVDNSKKAFIRVSVRDSGCGLTNEEIASLFQPFKQISKNQNLNNHGSGLGLTIVKEISEELGYQIKIDSKIDIGTVFYFDIPYNIMNEQIPEKNEKTYNSIILPLKFSSLTKLNKPLNFIDNLFRSKTVIKKTAYESDKLKKCAKGKFVNYY